MVVSWTSPVPGGMSRISASRGPHAVLLIRVSRAPMAMGPRQVAGASLGSKNAMLMQDIP